MRKRMKKTAKNIQIQPELLLGRKPVKLDDASISGYLQGKTVLVTGGGGSVGSELCRQIVRFSPGRLIVVDCYENNAYDICNELCLLDVGIKPVVEIANVRDKDRIQRIFDCYHPEIVFHAAAHKHVPLMEHNPDEAVKNNVLGTRNVLQCAVAAQAERFVLISTDKAVNPTSVMGATKRLCELMIQHCDSGNTVCAAVRFGNVLGSNGSVVPLFIRQIQAGGPVTLTDRRVTRYFMTITEAARLVLQAGAFARNGEIYVLDMGEQVSIYDLAVKMIRMYGLRPGRDIAIRITGLRPGEKLHEELWNDGEDLAHTSHKRIFSVKTKKIENNYFEEGIEELVLAAKDGDNGRILRILGETISGFRDGEHMS